MPSVHDACCRCHLRSKLCVCHHAPQLSASVTLLALTHEREPDKTSNTGRLLEAALSNCVAEIWRRCETNERLTAYVATSGLSPLLIFPADKATGELTPDMVTPNQLQPDVERYAFIILDATWQQAAKMVRQTPALRQMPRLKLPVPGPSLYQLRRNQQVGHVCTVEAGILLLQSLGFERDAEKLQAYFQLFLRRYDRHRGTHLPQT